MRESIGGGWMLGLVVVFIAIFSGYLAVSINYTKAFKVKNRIINLIEENEGFRGCTGTIDNCINTNRNIPTEWKVYQYLQQIGYSSSVTCASEDSTNGTNSTQDYGYCVKKVCAGSGAYYKVKTFIKLELPIINLNIKVPISGETKVLYYTNDGLTC